MGMHRSMVSVRSERTRAATLALLLVLAIVVCAPALAADASAGHDASTGASAASPSEDEALDRLFAQLAAASRATVRFRETRHISEFDVPMVSRGTLVFVPPDTLEKRTTEPVPELLRLGPDTVEIAIDGMQRRMPTDAVPEAAALGAALRGLLTGRRELVESAFALALDGAAGSRWTLVLTPRDAGLTRTLREIEIAGAGDAAERIVIWQGGDDRSELRIER